jgi:hypothetical protein
MRTPLALAAATLLAAACTPRQPAPGGRTCLLRGAPRPRPRPRRPSPPREPLLLVSGRSLGPVQLGMTVTALRALGGPLQEASRRGDDVTYTLAPLSVGVRNNTVVRVALTVGDHPGGLRIGATRIAADTPTETVTAALPGCGPIELNRGGAVAVCDNGRTRVMRVGPPAVLAVEVIAALKRCVAHVGQWSDWLTIDPRRRALDAVRVMGVISVG